VGPAAYRLGATPTGYHWTTGGDEAASAVWRDGTWDVFEPGVERAVLTLIPVTDQGVSKVALVDHPDRIVATFTPASWTEPGLGAVRDSYNRVLLLVRTDGPTGIHVTDGDGNVLALASTLPGRTRPGLDVLLTTAGACTRTRLVLGLTLATELLRLDALRPVQ
jgi:hypothetical protein